MDLPAEMQRAMARQAEAERERRAKIIHARGEFQAAARLREAGATLAKEPVSLQLRYLSTLSEIAHRAEFHNRVSPFRWTLLSSPDADGREGRGGRVAVIPKIDWREIVHLYGLTLLTVTGFFLLGLYVGPKFPCRGGADAF